MGAQETSASTMDVTAPISVRCSAWLDAIVCGDCLEEMPKLPAQSVDAIISDLPYGTTACKWDSVLPLETCWREWARILKPGGAIVLTASQPFTSALVMSNPNAFKHEWIWNKKLAGNAVFAKKQPLKIHETVLVFAFGRCPYKPEMRTGTMRAKNGIKNRLGTFGDSEITVNDQYYPTSILEYSNAGLRRGKLHLAQKPVELMRYLVRTYTNSGDVVLDPCCGSGTTCLAAMQEGRHYIGIEKEQRYADIAKQRIHETLGMASNKALSESHEDEPQR